MPEEKRYLDRFDSAGRKKVPMFSGVMAYFPDAIAALAEHSYKGNEKHNPGEPLHHARGKSMDHTDCIMRHLANYNGMDGDALEAVALFWRAGALCQEVLERKFGLTLPEGVIDPRAFPETNSLVGPNGEQAPLEAFKAPPKSTLEELAARSGLPLVDCIAKSSIELVDTDRCVPRLKEQPPFRGEADTFGGPRIIDPHNPPISDKTEERDMGGSSRRKRAGGNFSADRDPTF